MRGVADGQSWIENKGRKLGRKCQKQSDRGKQHNAQLSRNNARKSRKIEATRHRVTSGRKANERHNPGDLRRKLLVEESKRPVGGIHPYILGYHLRAPALKWVQIRDIEWSGKLQRA